MDLVSYYNKFNEDKRLLSRHGQVEFNTTVNYILKTIEVPAGKRIIDIGAGTGRYSVYLSALGCEVTSVEYVKYNLGILKKNVKNTEDIMLLDDICPDFGNMEIRPKTIRAYQGDARRLKRFPDSVYDATLLFGPMYHLHSIEDKAKALSEAVRVTKDGGYIFVAYVMADYAVIKHGFMEGNIKESLSKGALTDDYSIKSDPDELYDYVRLNDINVINNMVPGVNRETIITPDGAADYIRPVLNDMDEDTFNLFMDYQIKNAMRPELVGAGSHTVDILRVTK